MSDEPPARQSATGECIAQAIGPGASASVRITEMRPPDPLRALHQLRPPTPDFVGREQELARLVQTLTANPGGHGAVAAICGIRGLGGIGKSELAYAVADRVKDQFPDGALLIALLGMQPHPLTPKQALRTVIQAFGQNPEPNAPLVQLQGLYRSLLYGKRVLLLADDAHNDLQVAPLAPPPPGCALLITSRPHITLPGLLCFSLSSLPAADAVALLHTICPRIGSDAPELARLCGRLPLALRVSATFLQRRAMRPVGEYIQALRDERERLRHLRDPHNTALDVAATLHLSYAALGPAQQSALAQLSVFVGSFDPAAAWAVVSVPGDSTIDDLLEELCLSSLLDYSETSNRYELHDLVRVFAAGHLTADEETAARLRHARHYAQVADSARNLYHKGSEHMLAGLALFDHERSQIDAAWGWLMAEADVRSGSSDESPGRDSSPGYGTAPHDELRLQQDALLLGYANATASIGMLRYDTRRERMPQLAAHLAAARRLQRRDQEGRALGNLGIAYDRTGEYHQAITYHEQSLVIARERGDRISEGTTLGNLGLVYYGLEQYHQAIDYHKQHLAIAREVGDREGEGRALGKLGLAYYSLGQYQEALAFHEQHLAIAYETGDREGESDALGNLGLAYGGLGQYSQAIVYHEQYLLITREIGDREGESDALGNLGFAYDGLGEYHQAITHYEQALEVARAIGNRSSEARYSWILGFLHERQGDLTQAVVLMQVGVGFLQSIGHAEAEKYAAELEQVRARLAAGMQDAG